MTTEINDIKEIAWLSGDKFDYNYKLPTLISFRNDNHVGISCCYQTGELWHWIYNNLDTSFCVKWTTSATLKKRICQSHVNYTTHVSQFIRNLLKTKCCVIIKYQNTTYVHTSLKAFSFMNKLFASTPTHHNFGVVKWKQYNRIILMM